MELDIGRQLGRVMWQRAEQLQYRTRDELADAAGVSRRTVQGLLNGSSTHPPTARTLNALDIALALPYGTLVSAFRTGNPDLIADEPLDGSTDPGAWLLRRLHTRGAVTDPDTMRTMASLLDSLFPDAARVLSVIAEVADSGQAADAADAVLTGLPAANRTRRRRAVAAAAHTQLPLVASA